MALIKLQSHFSYKVIKSWTSLSLVALNPTEEVKEQLFNFKMLSILE